MIADYMPEFTADDLSSNEGLQVAYGMLMWSFATYEGGVLTATDSGATFDLANGTYPTIDDFYATANAKYPTAADYDTAGESYTGASVMADARENFISTYGAQDESMGEEGVPNISGIQKIDDYTVSVTTNGFSVTTIYNLGINVAPMHYYGDESLYDYENNQFGFEYGNLDKIRDNLEPMGAGPYVFDRYENRTVYFTPTRTIGRARRRSNRCSGGRPTPPIWSPVSAPAPPIWPISPVRWQPSRKSLPITPTARPPARSSRPSCMTTTATAMSA